MKALIVEDEPLNALHLQTLLKKRHSDISVLGVCQSVEETIQWLGNNPLPELMFLDIHVADGLVFELFKTFTADVPIIFTTAYDAYALKAFKLNSIDYLLKPVRAGDLDIAIEKLKRIQPFSLSTLHPLLKNFSGEMANNYKARFMVRLGEQIAAVRTEEIRCFHYEEGLVFLHKSDGKKFPVEYSLDALIELLDPHNFFRINRKTIVSIAHIGKMHVYFNSRLKLECAGIPEDDAIVSRERTSDFKKWLDG